MLKKKKLKKKSLLVHSVSLKRLNAQLLVNSNLFIRFPFFLPLSTPLSIHSITNSQLCPALGNFASSTESYHGEAGGLCGERG